MSRIKSALELALERTEGVEGDSEKLKKYERSQDGKRLLAKFYHQLTEAELNAEAAAGASSAGKELRSAIKAYPKKEQAWVYEGLQEVLLNGISLPSDENAIKKLEPVHQAARAVSSSKTGVDALFQQAQQLFSQYLQEREQLIENLKQQFAPRLKQKEEAYTQQTGQEVSMKPESDPEFQQYLQRAMEQLQDYYQQVVDQIRQQLPQYL